MLLIDVGLMRRLIADHPHAAIMQEFVFHHMAVRDMALAYGAAAVTDAV